MKRCKEFLSFASAVVVILCLVLIVPVLQAQATVHLKYATMFPSTHIHGVIAQRFADAISERTDGKVKITVYTGGTLVSAPKIYHAVVKGIIDIGGSCPLYVKGRFPATEYFEYPRYVPNAWVNSMVINDWYWHFRPNEYDDVQVLYMHGPGRAILIVNKPIRRPQDLRGMTIRASGVSARIIEAWGGVPRVMPMGEGYEAMQKRIVDGIFAYPETLKGYRFGELAKYVIILPISCSSCQFVAINREKWNSLSPEIQKVFLETAREFVDYQGQGWNYIDEEGYRYFLSLGQNREIIRIPAEERAIWEKPVRPIIEEYIQEKTKMNIPMREYVDYIEKQTKHFEKIAPTSDQCEKTVRLQFPKYLELSR